MVAASWSRLTPEELLSAVVAFWFTVCCAVALFCACCVTTPIWLTRLLAIPVTEAVLPFRADADRALAMARILLLSPVLAGLLGPTVKVSPAAGEPLSVSCAPANEIGVPLV